jgi:methylmalonyl-CoA carboxyltransferase large subunit
MKKPIGEERALTPDLAQVLAELQGQLAALGERLGRLEARAAPTAAEAPPAPGTPVARAPEASAAAAPAPAQAVPQPEPAEAPSISEEEILAFSAALGAFLGVRLRIRQFRLLSSPAWAQQGRVSIQASHQLHN